ncbi:MAG: hypothetical protein J6I55_01335 [Ruminococcus sp.]|nr:hypothetical protein [Ruminococcus sp.]HAE53253.1 hypothetical protein [Ruminococcus sp.]
MFNIFSEKKIPIPQGFSENDVKIESSICTGEKTIGFYDKHSKKLMFAELVKSESDIDKFYNKYGIERKK